MNSAKCRLSLIGGCAILLGVSILRAEDWPQWRGANRDAKTTFTAPATWPKQLTQKWKVTVGTGDATPALVGDKLYTFTRQGEAEMIMCLDAGTGNQIWKRSYPSAAVTGPASRHPGPRSSPAVADGKVVTLGVTEIVSCFDAQKGDVLWRKEFSKEYSPSHPNFYTATSPIIVDNLCITHVGGDRQGAIIAFDLTSGEQKWKWEGDAPAYSSPVLMTSGGTKQIVEESAHNVVGIATADGKLLWEIPFQGMRMSYNAPTPLVSGETVIYTGGGRGITAVKIEKQGDEFKTTPVWSNKDVATQFNTPVAHEGLIFGLSDKGNLFCVDAKDGKTLWKDDTKLNQFGSLVDAGSVIFALTPASDLIVFRPSPEKFDQIAKYKVAESQTYAYPVVSGDRLYIKDNDSVTMFTP